MNEANFKRILVVDDNEIDRYIAKRNIEKSGFAKEVILKDSAGSALEYLSSLELFPDELPQMIFLDVRMPGADGFDFLDAYDKLPDIIRRNCIIMLLSTSLNPADHEKAKNSKYVKMFLNKPLTVEELNRIRKLEQPVD